MSTSLNSTQIQNHINPTGNSSGAGGIHSATSHVPSVMSTSLHSGGTCSGGGGSGSGSGGATGGGGPISFDNNSSSWNSTSSLSPTMPSQLRKCEVKLNAMPYVLLYFFQSFTFTGLPQVQ